MKYFLPLILAIFFLGCNPGESESDEAPKSGLEIRISAESPHLIRVEQINHSADSIRIWERWNSRGYDNLHFEFTSGDSTWKIYTRAHIWTRNFPSFYTIPPGQSQTIRILLNDHDWEGLPKDKKDGQLKAVFEIGQTDQSDEYRVWTGKATSEAIDFTTVPFVKDIPAGHDGEPILYYQLTKQKKEQLELTDIENGFDSLQIRIWFDYTLRPFGSVLIFSYQDGKWEGKYISMDLRWDHEAERMEVVNHRDTSVAPKSGWKKFISSLEAQDIHELPDMSEVEGLKDNWTDGHNYHVEIGTPGKYRFYSYHLPEEFQEFEDARKMMNIIHILNTEILYKVLLTAD